MHLVRIHVKPRPQHGPHQPADPTDPTAVNIRRGYELPTRTERVARWSSSIWHYLPFVSQVSPSQNKTRFSFDRNHYCNKNLLNVCQLPMQLIPTEIDIRSPRILIEFDLHNNVYVKCIDIGYILRLFYRVFRKEIFFSPPLSIDDNRKSVHSMYTYVNNNQQIMKNVTRENHCHWISIFLLTFDKRSRVIESYSIRISFPNVSLSMEACLTAILSSTYYPQRTLQKTSTINSTMYIHCRSNRTID